MIIYDEETIVAVSIFCLPSLPTCSKMEHVVSFMDNLFLYLTSLPGFTSRSSDVTAKAPS